MCRKDRIDIFRQIPFLKFISKSITKCGDSLGRAVSAAASPKHKELEVNIYVHNNLPSQSEE